MSNILLVRRTALNFLLNFSFHILLFNWFLNTTFPLKIVKLSPFMALSYFIRFQRSQSLHGWKTRFNLWISEIHYYFISMAWRNKRVCKSVGTLLQCHTFEYERNPQRSNVYLTPSFITRKLYLFSTHCERHYAGILSWLWHKILNAGFPKLVHTSKNPEKQNIVMLYYLIVIIYIIQYLSEILSRH